MASPSLTMRAASRATASFSATLSCNRISNAPSSAEGAGTAPPRTRRSRRRRPTRPQAPPPQPLQVLSDGHQRNPEPLGQVGHAYAAGVLEEPHDLMLAIAFATTRHRATSQGCVREVRSRTVDGDFRARQWSGDKWPTARFCSKASGFRWTISELVLEMEDPLQQDQPLVRAAPLQADEERGHVGLPPPVDVGP